MKSNYKRLGDFIQLVDERNRELLELPLMGLSVTKKFFPTIANLVGTDMKTYKIVYRNQFTYIADTSRRGEKIAIAINDIYDKMLVSQAYTPFEVKDVNKLDPEYLMMWFRRPEFDRYARFKSHGSAREIFDWSEMCQVELPIPSIEKQREIVREYNTFVNRIKLNEQLIQKLEETAQAIYKRWFVEFEFPNENNLPYKSNGGKMVWCEELEKEIPQGWRVGKVAELCEYSSRRISINELGLESYISTENMLQYRAGIVDANNLPTSGSVTRFEIGYILISNIRPYFKKIWLASYNGGCSNDVLCFIPNENVPPLYLYQILEKDNFFDYVMAGSKGTKMPRGDKRWIMNYETVIPSNNHLENYSKTTQVFQNGIQIKKSENQKLTELKELLLSKITKVEETTEKEVS